MARENKTKYAVLAFLTWHPMSGYDVKKIVEKSISNFWSESYGQIYPILKKLVTEGLASSETKVQQGRPSRQVYSITTKGREELKMWLSEPSDYNVGRIEILLKLFFSSRVPVEVSRKHVEEFIGTQKGLLYKYETIEENLISEHDGNPELPYWLMTLSFGKHQSEALVKWGKETLKKLNEMES